MKIDKITDYDKKRDKVLFEEGLVILFYKGETRRLHLKEGLDVSTEMYDSKIVPILQKRARERIVNILKSSDKSEAELRRKLKEGFYPPDIIDYVTAWGKEHHFIDDERYIDNYIRYHSDGKSAKKIMYDLMGKGLKKEDIIRFLENAEIDERGQIEKELIKRHYSDDMEEKEKQKIIMALARKGYSWDKINEGIQHLLQTS